MTNGKMTARLTRLMIAVALASGVTSLAAPAAAHAKDAKTLVLHLRFHAGSHRMNVMDAGRYLFLSNAPTRSGTSGTLIDDDTGKRVTVSRRACAPTAIGGPWLSFLCDSGEMELYGLSTGTWQAFTPDPFFATCTENMFAPTLCELGVAVGANWVESASISYHASRTEYGFKNIQTGETRGDPTTSSTYADPNSPSLTQTLCAPLAVPQQYDFGNADGPTDQHEAVPGSVGFYGGFVVTHGVGGGFLNRCGTHMHRHLGRFAVANAHLVIWRSPTDRKLHGLFLPSLRQFIAPLPKSLQHLPSNSLVLGTRRLYLLDAPNHRLFTAAIPQKP